MRWFVVFLLLANMVLYIWMAYGESPRPAHEPPPPDIGRLRLLHEAKPAVDAKLVPVESAATVGAVDERELRETVPRTRDRDAVEAASALAGADDAMSSAGLQALTRASQKAVRADVPLADSAGALDKQAIAIHQVLPDMTTDEPAVETGGVASAPVAARVGSGAAAETIVAMEPAGLADRMQEASSMSSPMDSLHPADAAADSTQLDKPALPVVTGTAANRCLRIGPLSTEQAQELRAKIPDPVRVVEEERRDVPVIDGYYVLIPPLLSRQEGNKKLDELDAAGVKDTWLFRSGELRNAISLGYFKREASALRHAETIRGLGFGTEVREKSVQAEQIWLLLSRPPALDADFVSDQAPDGSLIEPVVCPAQ